MTLSNDQALVQLTLNFENVQRHVEVRPPNRSMPVVEMLPVLHRLEDTFTGMATEVVEAQGRQVTCCAGCGACCRQLVPISEAEALHLARVVQAMPPDRQQQVRERFRTALAGFEQEGLLERVRVLSACNDHDERRELGHAYFSLGIPCPFLDDESCGIHPDRPLRCREHLVTSPAENCKTPSEDRCDMVPMPGRLSEVLFRFADGVGNAERRVVALVLALEFADEHGRDEAAEFPAGSLLRNFLERSSGLPGE